MDLWKEQRQPHQDLVKGLYDTLKEQPVRGVGPNTLNSVQYRLSKLIGEDVVEAFLHAFEVTATTTGWPQLQWTPI